MKSLNFKSLTIACQEKIKGGGEISLDSVDSKICISRDFPALAGCVSKDFPAFDVQI